LGAWRVRLLAGPPRRRGGAEAWAEAACPVCIGLGAISDRVPGLAGLTAPDVPSPGEGTDPAAQES